MSLTLSDALSHYHSISDTTHRFWGYFQAIAAGTAAFAWSREDSAEVQTFIFLAVAFSVFAVLNWRLVVSSQAEAVAVAQCVKNYASSAAAPVPAELQPLVERISPDPPFLIGLWHAGLSLATLGAIWWRYDSLVC